MEAAPVNIIQYFDGTKQHIAPLFQREYCWSRDNWDQLWSDLMMQYEEESRSSHFMGAIVTVPEKTVPAGVTKHLVIDGQQRLITLSIILAAIRDKSNLDNNSVIGDMLVNRHYQDPDHLKVVPTQVDRASYNALINKAKNDLKKYESSQIIQAYSFFMRKLEEDINDQPIIPSQILQAIQQSLQVVMINLSNTEDPYQIFESLNHKGEPLNQADLVRNYVLMRFQHSTSDEGEQAEIHKNLWRPMEVVLDAACPDPKRRPMVEFLRHYAMRHGHNVRKGDIYTISKAELGKLKSTIEVKTELQEMKRAAQGYGKFLDPKTENIKKISKKLKVIKELDSTTFYPLLIKLYGYLEQNIFDADAFCDCLDLLESFYVRRQVCNVPTNSLNKITLELCLHLQKDTPQNWLRSKLIQGERGSRWPSDEEFVHSLVDGQIYNRTNLASYVLIALEEAHGHKEEVDSSSATIEHIMPQTLTKEWKENLGSDYETVHRKWLHTLGNLTLTNYNSELSNNLYLEKRLILQESHFELNRGLPDKSSWGDGDIEDRGKQLADLALKRWKRG